MMTIEIELNDLKALCLEFLKDGYFAHDEIDNALSQGYDLEEELKLTFNEVVGANFLKHNLL